MNGIHWLLFGSCLMLISQIEAVTEELSPGEFPNWSEVEYFNVFV